VRKGLIAAASVAGTAKRRLTAAAAESHFAVDRQQHMTAREDEYLFTIVVNVGSRGGLFACPGGIAPGEFIGEKLFAA
jgi:hypothetical protein